MPKSFFDAKSKYTKEGAELLNRIDSFLDPIYDEFIKKGYNLREIQQIVNNSVTLIEVKNSVKFAESADQEDRKKMLDARFS